MENHANPESQDKANVPSDHTDIPSLKNVFAIWGRSVMLDISQKNQENSRCVYMDFQISIHSVELNSHIIRIPTPDLRLTGDRGPLYLLFSRTGGAPSVR